MDWKEFFKPTTAKLAFSIIVFVLVPLPFFSLLCPQYMLPTKPICYPVPNFVSFLTIVVKGYPIGRMTPLGVHYLSIFDYFTTEYWSWISLLINLLISYTAVCCIIKIYQRFKK